MKIYEMNNFETSGDESSTESSHDLENESHSCCENIQNSPLS